MTTELTIGLVVGLVLLVALGIKGYLHSLLSFKMDESTIVKFFGDSESKLLRAELIAAGTDIGENRVDAVCAKSKLIQRSSEDTALWCLK